MYPFPWISPHFFVFFPKEQQWIYHYTKCFQYRILGQEYDVFQLRIKCIPKENTMYSQ